MRRKSEVMSPAGYWPQLEAAIEAGADAVYFGLKHFTARAKVGFSLAELPDVMRTLHKRGVRGLVTFNTLVFEHEIDEAARAIASIVEAGADALIIQDVGILKLARAIAPDVELHASTQMSITNAEGVRAAQRLGVNRVTLARELSLAEIRKIIQETDCELEVFVHGALCVAYSGQCFSSEAWGGRSANRGQCAQACRLEYELFVDGKLKPLEDARYLLSPGDLYALEQVPELVDMGVATLKIEGRYKDADYVTLTTRAYRAAVDAAWAGRDSYKPGELERIRLEQVYSRGLGPWFMTGTNHQAVVRGRSPRHRGVLMGAVTRVTGEGILITPSKDSRVSPLKPGDGVVFDAASWRSPGETEEGGRIYEVLPSLDGLSVEIRFGNRAVAADRIRVGDLLWRTHDPDLDKVAKAEPFTARQRVDVTVDASPGSPLRMVWTVGRHSVTVESDLPLEPAQNRGLTVETVRSQLGRLGGTAYELGQVSLNAEAASVFAPASVLNQLRREAVEKLAHTQSLIAGRAVEVTRTDRQHSAVTEHGPVRIHLLVRTPEQLTAAIALRPDSITLDYLDLYGLRPSIETVKAASIEARVATPRILKPGEARILNFLKSLHCPILVRGAGMIDALKGVPLIGDFSLNAANSLTAEALMKMGLSRLTPTHDLNADQITDLAGKLGGGMMEVIAYQHLPVFHTEHCVFCRFLSNGTSYLDCGRPCEQHRVALQDHSGRAHPVMADVGCRNTVFGAEAQEASAHLKEWMAAGIRDFRLEFVHETAAEVAAVAEAFRSGLEGRTSFGTLGAKLRRIAPGGTTEGSLLVPKNYLTLPILQ